MPRLPMWILACVCLVAGCGSRGGGEEGEARPLKVAFVTNNSADFWTIARRGVERADEELADVEAEFRLTPDGTAAEQQRIVDDLLTKGVDALAISPVDPQNQLALIDAAAQRALVFTQDSDAPARRAPATSALTISPPAARQGSLSGRRFPRAAT